MGASNDSQSIRAKISWLDLHIQPTLSITLTLAAQPDNQFKCRSRVPSWHLKSYKHVRRDGNDLPTQGKFLIDKTKQFAVDGTKIPDVDFDVGESYAGLLPISNSSNETRQLYFWFWPSIQPEPPKEIVIWLNGGPGCSSLIGLIGENGPFTWMDGTYKPVPNAFDWRNLTNVLWVEQPVGVGYSQGNVSIKDEPGLAKQFIGFYEQFIKTFDVQGWDLYLNGESYAGVTFNDPILSDPATAQSITLKDFYLFHNNLYGYNTTTLVNLTTRHFDCGYDKYLEKYFTFPPPQEPFPILPTPFSKNPQIEKCDTYSLMAYASQFINPCFNIYRIIDHCPVPWSVLGPTDEGQYNPAPKTVFFNRTDVQKAINAPVGTAWIACSSKSVFVNETAGDESPPVAQTSVLTRVIEATNNVIIGSGNLDAQLSTNGTILSLQNITWNGHQGFKTYPSTHPFFVPYHPNGWNPGSRAGAGVVGSWGEERGLIFYQVRFAGHLLPADAPGAAYRVLEKLLGRIKSLDEPGPFTTQKDVKNSTMWTGGFLFKEDEGVPPIDGYEVERMVREGRNGTS
ncbi:putative serine carboxypeptidase [Pseudocercospora fuligena]|uniref:Putative serine carboxypeptidase n=1 Tax=Pseudocercospora fuligena TaxID=685502 RepID=A0A8H6RR12_9PEZI|nr:putative serine carboxypeptidase [Pseudocercospora fuligena]